MSERPVIAVSLGDPHGIGPEIAVGAVLAGGLPARLLLVGDAHVVEHYAAAKGATVRTLRGGENLPAPDPERIDVFDVSALDSSAFEPGACNAASGRATVAYLEAALDLVRAGQAQAIVGCPHHEGAVNASGTPFSGYPDLLGRLTGAASDHVILMLTGGDLRIAHVTLHEAVGQAVGRLNEDMVYRAALTAIEALRGIAGERPKLGLFGIDPHAGEDGLFGDADERITKPVAERLRGEGHDIAGPAGADLLLSQRECDGYLAMFHDQGHIPIKLIAGRDIVAFSIGADLLFASVGHGSAPDIAGKGMADCAPLMRSIDAVARMCRQYA